MSLSNVQQDLQVERVSDSLAGLRLDVVVSGSIGAIESVRFIRALRRLGAEVTPWLTQGGAQFITPMSLAWAAANETKMQFAGDATHLATGDACIVAPASANFIGQIAQGMLGTPAAALVHSYLGQGRPVLMLPAMHNSLRESPAVSENIQTVGRWVTILNPRLEEGKQKFPEPAPLADECAHVLSKFKNESAEKRVLVTMGTTRGYLDDVRYFSNYSSGALGTLIATELYRRGFSTDIVAGPALITPKVYSRLVNIETNSEMLAAARTAVDAGASAAVFAASVLDYVPAQRQAGKLRSGSSQILVELKPTEKIIAEICAKARFQAKVGFKLEVDFSDNEAGQLAEEYALRYGLTMVAVNRLSDVDAERHRAVTFTRDNDSGPLNRPSIQDSKAQLATSVADHVVHLLQ